MRSHTILSDYFPQDVDYLNKSIVDIIIEHVKQQLTEMQSKVSTWIDMLPNISDIEELKKVSHLYDNYRSFYQYFEYPQLQGLSKFIMDSLEIEFKKMLQKLLKPIDDSSEEEFDDIEYDVIADMLIDAKLMAIHISGFCQITNKEIDKALSKLKNTKDGNKKIGSLSVVLVGRSSDGCKGSDGTAQMIIAEHSVFTGFSLSLRNTKTLQFTIEQVLEKLDGTNVTPGTLNKLRELYNEFEGEYWKIVENGLGDIDNKKLDILSKTKTYAEDKNLLTKSKISSIIANIFAFWTLSNATHFLEAKEVEEEEPQIDDAVG